MEVNGTLLKIDASTAFATADIPGGQFLHAKNHEGLVCAAAETADDAGLAKAIRWAEKQIHDPDDPDPWPVN